MTALDVALLTYDGALWLALLWILVPRWWRSDTTSQGDGR